VVPPGGERTVAGWLSYGEIAMPVTEDFRCRVCDYKPTSCADQLAHLRDVHGVDQASKVSPELLALFEEIMGIKEVA